MSDVRENLSLSIRSQEAVVEFLQSRARFAGVSIIGRRKGIISNDIDAAIAELGACLYVLPGKPVRLNPNLEGPYADAYEVRIRAIENPALNSEQPTAHELFEGVLIELSHQRLPSVPDLDSALTPLENNGEETPDDERVIIDAVFTCSAQLPARSEA